MASPSVKSKSATEALSEFMGKLVRKAAGRMTDEEFKAAESKSKRISESARARPLRRNKA
jgi:hypothetical protein